jgi:hypothetical protein
MVIGMAASEKSGGGILSTMVDKPGRRTKAAMADIRAEIKNGLRDDHPMTVRQGLLPTRCSRDYREKRTRIQEHGRPAAERDASRR